MKISTFPRYLFWSYDPDADLPQELVAEQIILYGDLDDLFLLANLIPHDVINSVNQKILGKGRWKKRSYFVDKVILEQ